MRKGDSLSRQSISLKFTKKNFKAAMKLAKLVLDRPRSKFYDLNDEKKRSLNLTTHWAEKRGEVICFTQKSDEEWCLERRKGRGNDGKQKRVSLFSTFGADITLRGLEQGKGVSGESDYY